MTKKIAIVLLGFLISGIVFGCGKKKPDGMPKLVPCEVSVIQDGKPLEGAVVSFYSDTIKWSISGTTDANGLAKIHTHGTYPGSPEGEFKVTVTKTVIEQTTQPEPVSASVTVSPSPSYDSVDSQYKMRNSTPLTITVSGKTTQSFDVGAAVRDEIKPL
ncbi:MAG: carboxypeptidase regulatory-like domain-containing protein [Planctomycetia bacterium]|nr:carboxypeptidase regulatory-like domain-containing protein [Planctomycetia bacterium]